MPVDPDTSIEAFYDALAAHYDDVAAEAPLRRHRELPVVRDLLSDLDGARVLDAGSGTGAFAGWLAERGADVLVLDAHHPFHYYLLVRDGEYPDLGAADPVEEAPDVLADDPAYHDVERFRLEWGGGAPPGTYYRRPLSDLFGAVTDAGFAVTGVREPLPDDAFRAAYPDAYETLRRRPSEGIVLRGDLPG